MKFIFNNMKLRNKFLVLYIFAVFLPIILTNIIFYTITTNRVKEQKMSDISLVMRQMKADFLGNVDAAIRVSSSLYTDVTISDFFEKNYSSTLEYVSNYDKYLRGFNKYGSAFSPIKEIEFYTDNPSVLYSGGVRLLSEDVKKSDWYKKMKMENDNSLIVMMSNNENLSIIRELNYFYGLNSVEKIVKINVDNSTLDHTFRNVTFPGDIYLLNEAGNIEYSTVESMDWKKRSIHFTSVKIPASSDVLTEIYDINYLNGWKIVGVVAKNSLLEDVKDSGRFIFYLAFFNMIVPTIIIIIITNSLYIRLMKTVSHIKQIKDQNFQLMDGDESKDEIGILISEFNRMTKKIKELINDVYVANIQKKDLQLQKQQAHLSALQSQINPHFLFNSLETIRMRSIIKEEFETAKIIQNMAKMLRRSFTWGKDWIPIHEEMNIIISFLEIQKYRFDEKLTFFIDFDPALPEILIPNMTILPFVENASIHGIEPKKENGEILISVKLIDDDIQICIEDNGPGMDEERLMELNDSLRMGEAIGEKVGIKNVYYRLQMYYGHNFFFKIESEIGKGTKVIVKLPANNVEKYIKAIN